ncbi:hypothetical protein [Treponema sp.]|uniref:hypothetical protein n=1 Tax=Treponema sp. TaxID=166 RepID=UPI00298EB638|nr:hypothetical protein [Treponema sp.]MCQ2242085.1 hypothetical protein [Treponema sp.]
MGYSIDQLKKASSIKGNEGIPIQQQGVTRQFTPGLLDQAEIITAAGSQSSGVIRREMTYALKNNSAVINFTLEGAIGQVYNAASGNYDDNADAAAGWIVQVINISTRAHTIIHGSTSWSVSPNDTVYFYWTGSAWTLHNMRVNGLTVDGPFAGAGVDTKVGGMINNALANYTKEIYLAGNYDTLEDAIKAVSSQALPNTLYTIRFEQNGVHIGQFYSYSYKAEVPEFGMGTAIKFNGNAFKFYVDWNTHQWVINNA